MDVAEANVDKRLELLVDGGDVFEDRHGVFDGEVEDVGDGVAVEFNGEGFLVVVVVVVFRCGCGWRVRGPNLRTRSSVA